MEDFVNTIEGKGDRSGKAGDGAALRYRVLFLPGCM